jgi:hypothetical protein
MLSTGGPHVIAIDQDRKRIIKLAAAGIAILAILLFLRQCSLDPISGFDMRYGFAESNFNLAKDSRLPRWFQVPTGINRNDISVEFVYFLSKTKIAAINSKTGKIFFSAEADKKHHPTTESESKTMKQGWPCPSYNIITVNGVEEVVAHIERGDIVYIVEPSEVTPAVYNNAELMKRCTTLKYYD